MEELCYTSGGASLREPYVYRGEGNAHLTLALPASRKILRIKKLARKSEERFDDSEEDWRRDVRFYREIMMPLFAPFADDVEPVTITPDEIARLQHNLETIRPAFRRHQGLRCDNAALFTDYAHLPPELDALGTGPTYSIEIKPKLGFPINGSCLYCEKQSKNNCRGRPKTISKYCPLLLFSNDGGKMLEAIEGLMETPHNNFQIFKDGILHYGQDFPIEHIYDIVRDILGNEEEDDEYASLDYFRRIICATLFRRFPRMDSCGNCGEPEGLTILQSIYSVQAFDDLKKLYSVDFGGFEYADRYLEDVSSTRDKCPRCVMLGYTEERRSGESDENKYGSIKDDIDVSEVGDWEPSSCRLLKEQDCNVSVPHYVSKIARDCSFMITMKRVDTLNLDKLDPIDEHILDIGDGERVVFTIKVFDLYPKPQKGKESFT